MNKPFTFIDFLKEIHAEDYHGTDDDMPDDFDNWLVELDNEELITHAENAIKIVRGEL